MNNLISNNYHFRTVLNGFPFALTFELKLPIRRLVKYIIRILECQQSSLFHFFFFTKLHALIHSNWIIFKQVHHFCTCSALYQVWCLWYHLWSTVYYEVCVLVVFWQQNSHKQMKSMHVRECCYFRCLKDSEKLHLIPCCKNVSIVSHQRSPILS